MIVSKASRLAAQPSRWTTSWWSRRAWTSPWRRTHANLPVQDQGVLPSRLFRKRLGEMLAAPAFPKPLRKLFRQRLYRFSWGWDRGWAALRYFAADTIGRAEGFTGQDILWALGIVEAMARHRSTRGKKVLAWLDGQYGNECPGLMHWLRPCFAELAGELRLEEAVPRLLDCQRAGVDLNTSHSADNALRRIGGDVVAWHIAARWRDEDLEFRRNAACILGQVRGDFCVERSLALFQEEEDHETQLMLAGSLLENFSEEAVDPVWKLVADIDEDDLELNQWGLRGRLVEVCTIMGRTFPYFDQWRQAALQEERRPLGLEPERLADRFRPDRFEPKCSAN